jgi:hypothetical protein
LSTFGLGFAHLLNKVDFLGSTLAAVSHHFPLRSDPRSF